MSVASFECLDEVVPASSVHVKTSGLLIWSNLSNLFPRYYGYVFSGKTVLNEIKKNFLYSLFFSILISLFFLTVFLLFCVVFDPSIVKFLFVLKIFLYFVSSVLFLFFFFDFFRSLNLIVEKFTFENPARAIYSTNQGNTYHYICVDEETGAVISREFSRDDIVAWGVIEEFGAFTYIVVVPLEAYSNPPMSIYRRPHNRFVVPFSEKSFAFESFLRSLMKPSASLSRK